MRIAILHYSVPPVIGGVERVIGEQADALRVAGHEVHLFTARDRAAFLRALGEPTPPQDSTAASARQKSLDAVIVHNLFTMPFDIAWTQELLNLAGSRTDVRWINWVHDVRWSGEVPQAIHVAVSEHRRAEYAKVTTAPIYVIPNGVDASKVLGLTGRVQALSLEEAGLVLLQPTRFVRRKNIELGLRVLAAMPENTIYVVTAAPDPHQEDGVRYFGDLKKLAKELGVARRVLFLGEKATLTDADVRGLYQMADALFFPSTQEGYGLPLMEAALHGLPVFCSDIPAHREVAVKISTTFFKLSSSPEVIARKLKLDGSVCQRIERRRLMARLNWNRITQEMLEPLLSRAASS